MIKLKDILKEVTESEIKKIADRVYPQIVKDLGGQAKPVEVHPNIWDRLGAVAVEDLKREEGNPDAEYDPYDNIIYLYSELMITEENIIRSLLHEHTHTLQDQAKFKEFYDKGFNYTNHPYEKEALKAEENWKKYEAVSENFKDGKKKGKSRPGRVKRAGASCKGSVTDLRARAKKYGGERGKMYHWCANMKSGKKK